MYSNFIRLYLDFDEAKKMEAPNVASLLYDGFICQKTDETFVQTTTNGISFAGAIQVDLIDKLGIVIQNIDDNFAYQSFIDSNGNNQITFEFGLINHDYFTLPIHLKITDLVNGSVYYSNSFLVTNYQSNLSARFNYFNENDMYVQSIRFFNVYEHVSQNETNLKQYTTSQGYKTNYRQVVSYVKKWICEKLDFASSDRLYNMFSSDYVYLNNERVNINDFKVDERKGDVNYNSASFLVNKLNETGTFDLQLLDSLDVITYTPNIDSIQTSVSDVKLLFNLPISLNSTFVAKLYKDNVLTHTLTTATISTNELDLSGFISYISDSANYNITINANSIESGAQKWVGTTTWIFEIANGEFTTDFDNDFLI